MNESKYCTNLGLKYCSTWEQILVKIAKANTKDKRQERCQNQNGNGAKCQQVSGKTNAEIHVTFVI